MSNVLQQPTLSQQYYTASFSKSTPTQTVIRILTPTEFVLYGFEVTVYREDELYFVQSKKWDSLVGSGETYPEAKDDFLLSLREALTLFRDEEDANLSPTAIELRNTLVRFGKSKL